MITFALSLLSNCFCLYIYYTLPSTFEDTMANKQKKRISQTIESFVFSWCCGCVRHAGRQRQKQLEILIL